MTRRPPPARPKADLQAEVDPGEPALSARGKRAPATGAEDDSIPTELQIIFGENLRRARLKCGLTQTEVGDRCGMGVQYVSKVELGQKNLTLRTMQKLAEVVDHDVTKMLKRVAPRTPPASRTK